MQLFRGQFYLGPSKPRTVPPNFRLRKFDGNFLAYHQLLPLEIRGDRLLIGHAIDTDRPNDTNADIIDRLSSPSATPALAGRWVLIDNAFIVGDACGTLPIVWTITTGGLAVASSTKLLNACIGPLERDPRVDEFSPDALSAYKGRGLPFRMTEYRNVRTLLPNHFLDRRQAVEVRFHPKSRYPSLPFAVTAPQLAHRLTSLISSLSKRARVSVAITSGHDSRTIAGAAAKTNGLAQEVDFFTCQDPTCRPGSFDLINGRRISVMIGGHHRETPMQNVSPERMAIVQASERMTAERFARWTAADIGQPEGRIVVTGWCSEVGRNFYRWNGSERPTIEQLQRMVAAPDSTKPEIERWLQEAIAVQEATGTHVMDLFYWEMRGTQWIGSALNILNTSADWIAAFNCRAILDTMLSTDSRFRGGRKQQLMKAVSNELCPALAAIPYNPFPLQMRMRFFWNKSVRPILIGYTKLLGFYPFLKQSWFKFEATTSSRQPATPSHAVNAGRRRSGRSVISRRARPMNVAKRSPKRLAQSLKASDRKID